jgi:integrase
MLLPAHLRRSRHGIYYFRVILPAPLAALLGQRELVRSLGIRSPKLAKISGYQLWNQIEPLLRRLTRIMAIDPNAINPEDVKKLVAQKLDFRPDGGFSVEGVKTSDDPEVSRRELASISDMANKWREIHNFTAKMSDEEFDANRAEAEKLRDELMAISRGATAQRMAIDPPIGDLPLRPSTLREGFDAFLAYKRGIAQSSKDSYTYSFELFATLVGGEKRMCHEVTVLELQEFNDALPLVPLHAVKRGIKLGKASDLIANPPKAKDKDGNPLESISGESANLHLSNLQSFFDYLISSGRRNGANHIAKLTRHSDGEQGDGAVGFEEDELRCIFDPEQLMKAKRPTQFWGPLLALYTGARLNELACLDMKDFVIERGIPCISIRRVPRAKPNTIVHNAERSTKQVKNKESIRHVPLHPDLWEIGLQDYIDDMKSLGATRLFPTLPRDKKGKRERRLSHDGNEYLKEVGVHVLRVKVMHSFRDTVSDMLGIGDMDEFSADQRTGHATQGVKAKHYRRKVAADIMAVKGFKALDFPFIDTVLT